MFARTRRRSRAQSTQTKAWAPPIKGWWANATEAPLDSASQLDNFFPTTHGARLRKGRVKHATLPTTARRLMPYRSGDVSALFAGTDTALYEIASPADASTTPTASLSRLTGGDWSDVQFSTAGGDFMVAVNGSDYAFYYNGTDVQPISGEEISDLGYDGLTGEFTVGQMVTGGTSGATATIYGVAPASATAGTLKIGPSTGTFQDNEALTDPLTGAATSNIPSGVTSASSVTITGVETKDLNQVWHFKERLFFTEKNSLSVWYLPVNSIGGAASEINLGSILRRGGNLLFGATWSLDSGDGLDDKCIFVTDQGEIAVFEGTNPSSASTWGLVGVYSLGDPIDKHAWFRFGGDLVLLTDDGLVPVSQAVSKDRGQLAASALTYPIEDEWRKVIAGRTADYPITATLWQSQSQLFIGTPTSEDGSSIAFAANARTGAWCRYLNWDIRCSTIIDDGFYFGSDGGVVYQGEVGGNDAGTAFTGVWATAFDDCGVAGLKTANHAQLIARSAVAPVFHAKAFSDYQVGTISPPTALDGDNASATWGTAVWGSFVWGGSVVKTAQSQWKTVGASGFSIAAGFAVTSNSIEAPEFEVTTALLRYEVGSVL